MAAKDKTCKANVGTRKDPRECGKPVAEGMLQCCEDHRLALISCSGKPGVYTRGGRYVALSVYRGKQYKTFHGTVSEAVEAHRDRTGTVKSKPQSGRRFDDYAQAWIENYQGRNGAFDEDTRKLYQLSIDAYLIPHFRGTKLRDIDREDVDALIAKLQKRGLSAGSIGMYLTPLRAMFNDARLQPNPASGLRINSKATAAKSDRVKDLSCVELQAVIEAVPEGQDRLFVELLARTGCRISEALGLDWSDLGEDGATLRIERQWCRGKLKNHTKTPTGERTIGLPPQLGRKLWAMGADRTGPMFTTRTGERLSDRDINRVLKRAAQDSGVGHISAHSLRHVHGSILLDEGWPITAVAGRLGDTVLTIAKVYAHKLRGSDRDLSFLEAPVGNDWALERPGMAANAEAAHEPADGQKSAGLQAKP